MGNATEVGSWAAFPFSTERLSSWKVFWTLTSSSSSYLILFRILWKWGCLKRKKTHVQSEHWRKRRRKTSGSKNQLTYMLSQYSYNSWLCSLKLSTARQELLWFQFLLACCLTFRLPCILCPLIPGRGPVAASWRGGSGLCFLCSVASASSYYLMKKGMLAKNEKEPV